MQKAKLDVLITLLCYGGNGGIATVLPEIAVWLAKLYSHIKSDDRIGRIAVKKAGDIPLTMIRNGIVKSAKDSGFDVILMIDSDNVPDLYNGHLPTAKPFWDTSFDFLYNRKVKGLPTVVCAPYCGPPPHPVGGGEENVYVFHVKGTETNEGNPDNFGSVTFEAYSRDHAAIMRGIQPIAAGPTGCIMYSTDSFDLMPIGKYTDAQILTKFAAGEMSMTDALRYLKMESWFFYEFTDAFQTQKASTEDVTNTREIQFAGIEKHGEPVVFCNWDAWAGHYKPKCVGAPQVLRIEQVSNVFAEAVKNNISATDAMVYLDLPDNFDPLTDEEQAAKEIGEIEEETEPVKLRKRKVKRSVSSQVCMEVEYTIKSIDAKRVVVIGDVSGEVVRAAKSQTTYALGLEGEIDGVKVLVGLGTEPAEVAMKVTPAELDAIVIKREACKDINDVLRAWSVHLKSSGVMLVVFERKMQEGEYNEFDLDGFETLVGDRGDFLMIRPERSENASTIEL